MQKHLIGLASGSATTLDNICKHIHNGSLNAKMDCIISDNIRSGAADVAEKWKVCYFTISNCDHYEWNHMCYRIMNVYFPDLVVMGGFLRKLIVPAPYENRIIDIHPSLLPKYGGKGMYGLRVHKAVLDNKESVSGCTIHFVDNQYDHGKTIAQEEVPVNADDNPSSLQDRIQAVECRLYPVTIQQLLSS